MLGLDLDDHQRQSTDGYPGVLQPVVSESYPRRVLQEFLTLEPALVGDWKNRAQSDEHWKFRAPETTRARATELARPLWPEALPRAPADRIATYFWMRAPDLNMT